jgi:hypothetical protein
MASKGCFTSNGWAFTASEGPIADAQGYASLDAALGTGGVPLPEMVFASNTVAVRHEASGFTLRLTAEGALRGWHAQQLRTHGVAGLDGAPFVNAERYDVRFSSDYEGESAEGAGSVVRRPAAAGSLPMALLASGDLPIRFFASLPLYSSDLDDRGIAECVVKLRVMDGWWLLLLRCWSRLDRESIAVRDVRYFCRTEATDDAPVLVLQDVQERVADWRTLQAALQAHASGGAASPLSRTPARAQPPAHDDLDGVTARMPALAGSPRAIHPEVLASMKARAAKQGLAMDDLGRIMPKDGSPIASSAVERAGAAPAAGPRRLASWEQTSAERPEADPFAAGLASLRLAITPDEAFVALPPSTHMCVEIEVVCDRPPTKLQQG